MPVIVVNYCMDCGDLVCVTQVIDLHGVVRTASYAMPQGASSQCFGEQVGPEAVRMISRGAFDLCLPSRWRSRKAQL